MDFSALFVRLFNKGNWLGLFILCLCVAGMTLWVTLQTVQLQKDIEIREEREKCDSLRNVDALKLAIANQLLIDEKKDRLAEKDERIKKLEEKSERVDSYLMENRQNDARLKQKVQRNNSQSKVINNQLDKVIQ